MTAIDIRAHMPKPTGIFRFKVSVYVTIKLGQVTKVSVDDEADLSNPELVEGADLGGMVEAALDAQSWPTWEFGWTPVHQGHRDDDTLAGGAPLEGHLDHNGELTAGLQQRVLTSGSTRVNGRPGNRLLASPIEPPTPSDLQFLKATVLKSAAEETPAAWREDDCTAAEAEGWNIFDLGEPSAHIERDDETGQFIDDSGAWSHVRRQALAGSSLAIRALAHLLHWNPAEFQRTINFEVHRPDDRDSDDRCPWCDQPIPHDRREQFRAQIQVKEREQAAELDRRLQEQREALENDKAAALLTEQARTFEERQRFQTKVQDLQRQLEHKTAAELGEGAELDLFEVLKAAFEGDRIRRVSKGAPGADIVHEVVYNGSVCGKIVYDSKNRNGWKNEYVSKLRADQIAEKG